MTPRGMPDILTVDEVASYLKVPKSTVYKLAQEGKIPAQKVGKHWRFHKETIDEWISKRKRVVAGAEARK